MKIKKKTELKTKTSFSVVEIALISREIILGLIGCLLLIFIVLETERVSNIVNGYIIYFSLSILGLFIGIASCYLCYKKALKIHIFIVLFWLFFMPALGIYINRSFSVNNLKCYNCKIVNTSHPISEKNYICVKVSDNKILKFFVSSTELNYWKKTGNIDICIQTGAFGFKYMERKKWSSVP